MAGVRIKDLPTATPNKDSFVVIDGENGAHKVPLGALAGIVGRGSIAGFHNSIFRGENLKERFGISEDKAIAAEVSKRIADGSFDDLFIGDYWPVTITTEFGTETVEIVLAGFDVYMGSIYEYFPDEEDCDRLARHHAVCVTKKQFAKTHRMHTTSSIPSDGYRKCEIHTTTLPKYATALNEVLDNHIIEICDTFSYDLDSSLENANAPELSGVMTSWDYDSEYPTHLTLLTERELYGAPAYSSGPCEVGFETSQLPLFRLDPSAKITGSWYWLKDVACSSAFCGCSNYGLANCYYAGDSGGVRPRFLIG